MLDRRILFEYNPEFVKQGWQLSPFHLPLQPGVFEEKNRLFDGLFGLFEDSLPDGWGLLLMDRFFNEQGHSPTPLDRLAYMGTRAMGALSYHPEASPYEISGPMDLARLAAESERILAGKSEDILPELTIAGGSPGGARPKVLAGLDDDLNVISGVSDLPEGYAHYLIKFPGQGDSDSIGAIEFAYAHMAQQAGVVMPETKLIEARDGKRYFAIKRFDRLNGRIHMQSLGALIHSNYRIPNCDYDTYLKATGLLTRDVKEVEQAFVRMLFNILAHNRDDHVKNFAFILPRKKHWQLSPAYDLTFSEGPMGWHSMTVAGEGKNPSRVHCLELARKYDIPANKAEAHFARVREAVSQWSDHARKADVPKRFMQEIAQSLNRVDRAWAS